MTAPDGSIFLDPNFISIRETPHPNPWLIGISFVIGMLGVLYAYYIFRK